MAKLIDLTGQRFGRFIVIERDGSTKDGRASWLCQCDCGIIKSVNGRYLRDGQIQSCGCQRKENGHNKTVDITGQVFTYLTVIKQIASKDGRARWLCQCKCGNTVEVDGKSLRNGNTKSCGCLQSFGEEKIAKILRDNDIKYKQQQTFKDLISKKGGYLKFDFAVLKEDKIFFLIEYQGDLHFLTEPRGRFSLELIKELQLRDKQKVDYCRENNIPLLILDNSNALEKDIIEFYKTNNKSAKDCTWEQLL